MATTNTTATKAQGKLESWDLACPLCGAEGAISLDLNDLIGVSCGECEDSFAPETGRKLMAEKLRRWTALCTWLDLATDVELSK